jgi:tRNA U34 5-carboxymethylaminomethyl modifying enzyme MnmG/GidA
MKTVQTRVCIYPKDVQRITGKSERYCRTLLQKIKEYFKKEEHQFVTVEEFCKYTGIKKEEAILFLAA